MSKGDAQAFSYRERYPDPKALFTPGSGPVEDILDQAVFALDTSALLLPYGTGSTVLKDLEVTYSRLVEQGRLFIPGHAIREFLVNRDKKIEELYKQLSDKASKQAEKISYAIFEGDSTYIALQAAQKARDEAQKDVKVHATTLARQVREWMWNDPISTLYRNVFNPNIIVEPDFEHKLALEQLQREITHRIPPGYKDASKDENSAGDSLVWQALLQIGREKQRPLIFATGDTKSDWWLRSGAQAIHPRFELIHAYREASGGHPLFMLPLADVLTYLNVTADTVQDVREAAHETQSSSGKLNMYVPDEDVILYHLHKEQVHLIFDNVQQFRNRTLNLRLEMRKGHAELRDCIELLTSSVTFDWLPEDVSQATGAVATGWSATISAPRLPNDRMSEGRPLKSHWELIASLDGEDVASASFIIHLRLLRVEAHVTPSAIEARSEGSAPFTLEVRITPPLETVLPISLGNTSLSDTFVEEVEMGSTELVHGVLRAEGTLKFKSFEYPSSSGEWLVWVGDVFGYRIPHYWTLHADVPFVFPGFQTANPS